MAKLSHIDAKGEAAMVDVSGKAVSLRSATAKGSVLMAPATLRMVMDGSAKKGDVLAVARLAGIMAAKQTANLIPLCHPLQLSVVQVELTCDPARNAIDIAATCKVEGQTGVEMEALTAVSVACLTIYDMLKAAERGMVIEAVRLMEKSGGASGDWRAP